MAANINYPLREVSPGLPGGIGSALNITAAETIKASPGICNKLVCEVAGTITLNDAASTGASDAANEIYTGAMTAGQVLPLDWPCFAGITVSAVTGGGQFSLSFS